jgi:polyisoprenyl-teichoic acid--peptidoglycan teichoic acid transferase
MPKEERPELRRSQKKRKKSRKKRVIRNILLIVILLLLIPAAYAGYLYVKAGNLANDSYQDDGRDKSSLRNSAVDPAEDSVSVLFIGSDSSEKREDENIGKRSDTMILATFNKDEKSIKMLSVPRDTYTYVPYLERNTKINASYNGGPTATVEAVEELMQVPVDYYVDVNFEAFISVVNALDGVTVDVPYELEEMNSKDEKGAIHLQPGVQTLNGEEALALARTRKQDNDFARSERQQQIIKAMMDKATDLSSVLKYSDLLEAVGSNMQTNMTFDEMKSFVSYGVNHNLSMETIELEGQGGTGIVPGYNAWAFVPDSTSLANATQTLREQLELPALDSSTSATSPS